MSNVMLYVMVGTIVGMFTWAGFEYAKAGVDFLRAKKGQQSDTSATTAASPDRDELGAGGG